MLRGDDAVISMRHASRLPIMILLQEGAAAFVSWLTHPAPGAILNRICCDQSAGRSAARLASHDRGEIYGAAMSASDNTSLRPRSSRTTLSLLQACSCLLVSSRDTPAISLSARCVIDTL